MLKKTKIGIAVSLLIAFVVYGVFGYMLYRLHRLNVVGSTLSREVSELSKKENDTEKLKDIISATEEKRLVLDSYFVSNRSVATFLDALEQIGATAGTEFTIASVNEELLNKTPILSLEVTAKGTFEQLFNLISLLEVAPYEFQFETVNLRAGSSYDDEGPLAGSTAPVWETRIIFNLLTFSPSI